MIQFRAGGAVKLASVLGLLLAAGCSSSDTTAGGGGSGDGRDPLVTDLGPNSGRIGATELDAKLAADVILFNTDESTIRPDMRGRVDGIVALVRQDVGDRFIVEGHADERGTREYNLALGARRASSLRSAMISMGIDGARLQIVSYGKERPVAVGHTDGAWAQNRRALVVADRNGATS